ncbi:hypothetical protein BH10PAT4_BH10PAT4_5390 [soil metagenome]
MNPQNPQMPQPAFPQAPIGPIGSGGRSKKTLVIILLAIGLVITIGLSIWALVGYLEAKTNIDGKVDEAVTTAQKKQADDDEAKFTAREKEPAREFVGPDDYGRLTFNYPKTWSVYVNKDASTQGGTYEAYLNPVSVPAVSSSQQYSLRVSIEEKDYDKVVSGYSSLVKKGDLKSSAVSANGVNGTRIDGAFTKDIRGSAVIFKIRDKTLTLRTDANTFLTDFNALITTIKFNQ